VRIEVVARLVPEVSPTDSGLGLGGPGGSFTGMTLAGELTKDERRGRHR
jgi:hypothetical protein